jgi:hypothetical protein
LHCVCPPPKMVRSLSFSGSSSYFTVRCFLICIDDPSHARYSIRPQVQKNFLERTGMRSPALRANRQFGNNFLKQNSNPFLTLGSSMMPDERVKCCSSGYHGGKKDKFIVRPLTSVVTNAAIGSVGSAGWLISVFCIFIHACVSSALAFPALLLKRARKEFNFYCIIRRTTL